MKHIIYFILLLSFGSAFGQEDLSRISMATLNVHRNIDALINEQVIFTVKPNQDFIYDFDSKNAYLQSNEFGYIPDSLVKRTNKPFFQIKPSKAKFKLENRNELLDVCSRNNVKIQPIIDSIAFRKSESSLLRFWSLKGIMSGEASEQYDYMLFNLINSWDDNALFEFLNKQNKSFLKEFCESITSDFLTWPITRIDIY
jgi:hypothetical protein